jgi:hypothetical protein
MWRWSSQFQVPLSFGMMRGYVMAARRLHMLLRKLRPELAFQD